MSSQVIDKNKIKAVALSGGGLAGITHVMFIEQLKQLNVLQNIRYFSGTSAGAIAALLFSLGMDIDTVRNGLSSFRVSQLFDFKFIRLLENFEQNYGADSGEYALAVIMDLMSNNGHDPKMTMAEHFELTGKYLLVVATNVDTMNEIVITKDSYPDLSVIKAIRMSMSIPVLFTSIELNGVRTCDGALSGANLPQAQTLEYMRQNGEPDDSICFAHAIIPRNFVKADTLTNYLSNIFNKFSAIPYTYDKETTIETDIGRHSILDDLDEPFLREMEINIKKEINKRLGE